MALSIGIGAWFVVGSYSSEPTTREVFIMYAGSLIKTFESTIGPSFQEDTGYSYVGEGKGSVQLSNMIIDKQRNPDVFVSAGTIPIKKLINNSAPLAHWLAKFASAEIVVAYTPNSPFFNKRTIGNWLVNRPDGIRNFEYDSNYPYRFDSIGKEVVHTTSKRIDYSEPHNMGEIWRTTLCEMTRQLENKLNNGKALALQLVIDALNLVGTNPDFLNMRKAIELALENKGESNQLSSEETKLASSAISSAFRRFGMGSEADSHGAQLAGIVADSS